MKKIYSALAFAVMFVSVSGQTTLVSWNFTDNNTTADGGIAANSAATLSGTGVGALTYQNNPVPPVGIPYQSAPGWDAGAGTKYWQTTISTTGYVSIFLNSVQRSSNTGPGSFQIQCDCGTGFTTVSTVTVQNNWTSGVTSNLSLPIACNNNPTVIIRWVMNNNIAVNAGAVAAAGTSGIDDVSVIALSVLPISVSNVKALKSAGGAEISWTASNTEDQSYFTVEKSNDGVQFNPVSGQINALQGDHNYSYNDAGRNTGTVFYRIKISSPGTAGKYSQVVRIKQDTRGLSLNNLYPSPVRSQLNLQISSEKKMPARFEVIDLNGRVVQAKPLAILEGVVSYPVDLSGLTPGSYLVKIVSGEETITGRFIKQ